MSFPGFLKRWLGFSRRERSGTFMLAAILVIVIIIRIVYSEQAAREMASAANNREIPDSVSTGVHEVSISEGLDTLPEPWYFDPNRVTADEMVLLGLTRRQANTLTNYRLSGGWFYNAEDFRKIYGISVELQERLIPYIIINKGEQLPAGEVKPESLPEERSITINDPEVIPVGKVELNSADSSLLVTLRGIGPVLSVRIIKYRELLGGYISPSQLSEVYGIDSTLVSMLVGVTEADTLRVKKININQAGYGDIARHPYLTGEHARLILKYRDLAGRFNSPSDLVINRILSEEEFRRISPYLEIN